MKNTVPKIVNLKNERVISMMTAYDYPSAKAVSEAEIDIILVGDSLAQVVLGHDDTLSVTIDEMLHHVKAVTNAKPTSLVVADMPYMSFHSTPKETLYNASRFIQEGKADAVKLEGGSKRKNMIEALIDAEDARLKQEFLLFVQKSDITEEIDRLDSHIIELKRLINLNSPSGKKMDFLMQEFNREANTIGSKAVSVDISKISVELKVLIEQIREQIQNIE